MRYVLYSKGYYRDMFYIEDVHRQTQRHVASVFCEPLDIYAPSTNSITRRMHCYFNYFYAVENE